MIQGHWEAFFLIAKQQILESNKITKESLWTIEMKTQIYSQKGDLNYHNQSKKLN